jgi:glucose-6-phosphate isomerase
MIKLDYTNTSLKEDLSAYQKRVSEIHQQLLDKNCLGSDFVGWLDWPLNYDKEEFARIKETAKEIRERADVLIVCGIGGSYLGARSAIEMMKGL